MIAKLTGTVDSVLEAAMVVDVGGVGYFVHCSQRTLDRYRPGDSIAILVETIVREDAISLYGFAEAVERQWFRLLTSVQGVGAKAALAILGALSADALIGAIASGDRAAIARAVGVGPKLAARVVSELREQASQVAAEADGAARAPDDTSMPVLTEEARDAISALINLGYQPADALRAVNQAARSSAGSPGVEALIRAGLAELQPHETRA